MKQSNVFTAIKFAVRAHAGHFRKGTSIPYVVHPLSVGRILAEAGCDEDVIVAGFLHDTVEDTSVTIDEIRAFFGKTVAGLVAAVTEVDRSARWKTRKQGTIDALYSASDDVLLLALADKLDNIRSISNYLRTEGDRVWDIFNRPKQDQAWYFRALASCFQHRITQGPGLMLLTEFLQLVDEVFVP